MTPEQAITPEKLFNYAKNHAAKAQKAGSDELYPSLSKAASRFGCTLGEVEDAIEDYQGSGYMGVVVGFQCQSGGVSDISVKGQQLVEAYD